MTVQRNLLGLGVLVAVLCVCFFWNKTRQAEVPLVEKMGHEGILLVGNSVEPKGLDPHVVTGVAEGKILSALFEGLTRPSPKMDGEALPGMAQRWEVSADGLEWKFFLRETNWSDGEPVKASDFVDAWHRMLNPEFGAKYASMLYLIEGAQEYNQNQVGKILSRELDDYKPSDWEGCDWERLENQIFKGKEIDSWPAKVSEAQREIFIQKLKDYQKQGCPDLWERAKLGIRVLNPREIVVRLIAPQPGFAAMTSHHAWYPIPAHVVEKHGGMTMRGNPWCMVGNIVGNGAFVMEYWRVNDRIKVKKNDHYWDADKVEIRGIEFLPIVNGFTETRMFFAGMLHMTNNIPAEMISYAKKKAGNRFQQDRYFSNAFYRLNTQREALNDARVRRALALALNRDLLVSRVMGGAGEPCQGFVPPLPGYEAVGGVGYDPSQARKLFAEAGFPDGEKFPRLVILISTREVMKSMAEAVQAMWKKELGIEVEIQSREWTAYLQARERKEFDILASSWSGDYLDPATFLDLWRSNEGNNATNWANESYDGILRQALKEPQKENRYALMRKAEKLMLSEMPVIPLLWTKRTYLMDLRVSGWSPLLLDNHPWRDVSLQK